MTAVVSLLLIGAVHAEEPPQTAKPAAPEKVWYQLVNVTIPADSRIRDAVTINHPPTVYVILRIKGKQLGKYSQARKGWEVDFEPTIRNQWPIWNDKRKIYSLEVWDSNSFEDDMIFSITGLSGADFKDVIHENGSVNLPTERLATIRFEPVKP